MLPFSQFLYGCYILYRSTTPGVGPSTGNTDHGLFVFQCVAWMVFVISVGVQVIGQVGLNAAPTPSLGLGNIIGFCIFPIYLDGESTDGARQCDRIMTTYHTCMRNINDARCSVVVDV